MRPRINGDTHIGVGLDVHEVARLG